MNQVHNLLGGMWKIKKLWLKVLIYAIVHFLWLGEICRSFEAVIFVPLVLFEISRKELFCLLWDIYWVGIIYVKTVLQWGWSSTEQSPRVLSNLRFLMFCVGGCFFGLGFFLWLQNSFRKIQAPPERKSEICKIKTIIAKQAGPFSTL